MKPLQEQSYSENENRNGGRSQYDHLLAKTTKNEDKYGFRANDWKLKPAEDEGGITKSVPWDF